MSKRMYEEIEINMIYVCGGRLGRPVYNRLMVSYLRRVENKIRLIRWYLRHKAKRY